MMRAVAVVALLALLPLAGGLQPREDAPLEATSVAVAPAALATPSPAAAPARDECVLALDAKRMGDHVALAWNECAGVSSYQLWRGPSAAELVPLVEVNHASHVDFPSDHAVYAVRAGNGPLSEAAAIAWD